MTLAATRVLDRLPAEEPCLGAVFSSYAFDPKFFEEHVLRTVLRLTSDPDEHAERYHHEARQALQRVPAVAIVDAGQRQPGRRLPFDLLEVAIPGVAFHPKTALLLYGEFARLLVGSGNLTFSGYGGNSELFFSKDLRYADPEGAALLRAFDAHLERIVGQARHAGTQLALFRDELRRRIPAKVVSAGATSFALLDSMTAPILEQVLALLPEGATINAVGMLAPFYERDDAVGDDSQSVFTALKPRLTDDAVLDVGVSWENPQLAPTTPTALKDGLHRLWTWTSNRNGLRVVEHIVPTAIGPSVISYIDEAGIGRRSPKEGVMKAIEAGELWRQPAPEVFAPRKSIENANGHFKSVRRWLHPATRLVDGRPVNRPLHAKLLVLGYRAGEGKGTETGSIVVMGSPNMSRRALLVKAGPSEGNVEVAAAFRVSKRVGIRDLVPELVAAPPQDFDPKERKFPELGTNYALMVDRATHDPAAKTLRVDWAPVAAGLPAWRLCYDGRTLASSTTAPTDPVLVEDFILSPATAEVMLHVDGSDFAVPILVTDLIALPATSSSTGVGLLELLMLLGRRIGSERALQIAEKRAATAAENEELSAFFGEGFGPTDVFRAWWSVAEELRVPTLSLQAFRLQLEGSLGAGAAWRCMLDATAQNELTPEEVWFYGAELLRELRDIELPSSTDRDAKRAHLADFAARVRTDMKTLRIDMGQQPWVKHIVSFYEEAKA